MQIETKHKPGQAGAIEITPEMIEAGLGAMQEFYEDEFYTESESLIREVYCAMNQAASKQHSQVSESDR